MFVFRPILYTLFVIAIFGCTADVGIDRHLDNNSLPSTEPSQLPEPNISLSPVNPVMITLSGSCPAGATSVTLSAPVNQTGDCTNGTFSIPINLNSLTKGNYQVTFTFDNNTGFAHTELVVDSSNPPLSIIGSTPNSFILVNSGNLNATSVTGNCQTSLGLVSLSVSTAVAITPCNGGMFSTTIDLSGLANGNYSGIASQTDSAGVIFSVMFEVFKDDSGSDYLANQSVADNKRLLFVGSGVEGQNIKFSENGNYSVTATLGVPMATMQIRNGTNGYKVEGFLRTK